MESGAGGNRRKRRKAANPGTSPACHSEWPRQWREEWGSGGRAGGESEARKVPSAVSNQVGVRVRERHTQLELSGSSLPALAPSFFLLVHLYEPKPPRHTLLGPREGEVTWLVVQPCWAGDRTCLKECYGVGSFLKLVVGQGKSCGHKLGNPELHHTRRTTNRVKCQRLSYGLVLFARFGLFLSLPPPPPFEFA